MRFLLLRVRGSSSLFASSTNQLWPQTSITAVVCQFSSALILIGFKQSRNDYYLFYQGASSSLVILLVHVDDIILTGADLSILNEVKAKLQSLFRLKDLGSLKYFLRLEIALSKQGITLFQHKYTLSLLDDCEFLACKSTSLPMDPNLEFKASDGDLLDALSAYRRLIGRLSYLDFCLALISPSQSTSLVSLYVSLVHPIWKLLIIYFIT